MCATWQIQTRNDSVFRQTTLVLVCFIIFSLLKETFAQEATNTPWASRALVSCSLSSSWLSPADGAATALAPGCPLAADERKVNERIRAAVETRQQRRDRHHRPCTRVKHSRPVHIIRKLTSLVSAQRVDEPASAKPTRYSRHYFQCCYRRHRQASSIW